MVDRLVEAWTSASTPGPLGLSRPGRSDADEPGMERERDRFPLEAESDGQGRQAVAHALIGLRAL